MKANNQASVDNDDVNSSWDLIFLQGEKKTIKNANLFKVKSGIYKTKEIGRSESKNSTGSLDIHIGLSEKQYNEDSEIQDLELLIHLVGDYLNKLKKKLNILKENKIKERYNSSSTDSQNNSTDFINKPSKQPNKTTQCGNRKQHTTVNSCNKTGQLIFTENDLCTGKNKELSNNIHGEELSTRTEKQSSHIVSNESPKKHVSIKSNKSFSMNIPHSSLSIEHTGIRLSNLDEVNMEINDQIKRRNSNKPLSLEDAKRRINFNSGEKEDEEPSIHYEVESQIKTAQPSMPESITEENTEEDEESLHLEMSNSDSPRENILEKDPSNMLTIEDTEEDPLINSDKDNVFASLSTGKKVDSQFYSVQEECNDFVDNALEHIESDSHENLFFEPLIDMNRMTTVKKKRIHSDVQITKNKIDEIDSDLATSVKTSPRKRKTNIGKYEYNGSKKEAKTRSHRNKKLKATNISSPLSISESKTSRSKNDSICKSKLSSVSEEDNSSPDTEEDYFTPEGSPTKNEHHEATVSPQRLKSRLQNITRDIEMK
ncbi:unnamed protein product [Meganyctiphanes norvegica]|uniref:Uncharacterized protein n=1 Tax=Meganyctiphanes norvegica TaxID=48144 RepID=A0AAV2SAI3_MEGNR